MPAVRPGADGASRKERIARAIEHLNAALRIVDDLDETSLAGAKLQEALDALEALQQPDD
jgi:hypothetical protein